jgi:hypothetical protein
MRSCHTKWKLRLNRGLDNASIKRRFLFRRVLDRRILSLADQQLITGFALVLAGHIKFTSEIQGAHFSLIVYLGCLSSSPHLAGVITLRKYFIKHREIGLLRVWLIVIFALLLVVSLEAASTINPFCLPLFCGRFGKPDRSKFQIPVCILKPRQSKNLC